MLKFCENKHIITIYLITYTDAYADSYTYVFNTVLFSWLQYIIMMFIIHLI